MFNISYRLSHGYQVTRNRYSRLLCPSEDRLCAKLRVQEQSTNMTSQCQNPTFAWRHRLTVVMSQSLANRFMSDPKIVIHGNECITLFLTRYFMSWTHNSAKNNYRSLISPLSLRTVFSDLALWRYANVGYWHCDVIFIDCYCARKLAQRRSSLVNNNREYRFLTTWYSRLSV